MDNDSQWQFTPLFELQDEPASFVDRYFTRKYKLSMVTPVKQTLNGDSQLLSSDDRVFTARDDNHI